ncbi:hypothetical protein [Fodinicola feengrottensis]|uniref:hypothetical protein n=1 Tax=Fodinicola feengrottensis TaxID=435914 RepID=UPI00244162B1|nr:hypothetical protein [Fodinicola feengrottensis]
MLARRWATRHDLLHATIAYAGTESPIRTPNTGSLREDMIALLRQLNTRTDLAAVLGVQLGGYYQETGETLADLRDVILNGQDPVMASSSRARGRTRRGEPRSPDAAHSVTARGSAPSPRFHESATNAARGA